MEGEGEIGLGKLFIKRKRLKNNSANLISLFFFYLYNH